MSERCFSVNDGLSQGIVQDIIQDRNGYIWKMAHYLQPMPIRQLLLTADDHASVERSPLYQNPYWPTEADLAAEQ